MPANDLDSLIRALNPAPARPVQRFAATPSAMDALAQQAGMGGAIDALAQQAGAVGGMAPFAAPALAPIKIDNSVEVLQDRAARAAAREARDADAARIRTERETKKAGVESASDIIKGQIDGPTVAKAPATSPTKIVRVDLKAPWSQISASPEYQALPAIEQRAQATMWADARVAEATARAEKALGRAPDAKLVAKYRREVADAVGALPTVPQREWGDTDWLDTMFTNTKKYFAGRRYRDAANPAERAAAEAELGKLNKEYEDSKSALSKDHEKRIALMRADMSAANVREGKPPELTALQETEIGLKAINLDPVKAVLGSAGLAGIGIGASLAGAAAGSLAAPGAGTVAGGAAGGALAEQDMTSALVAAEIQESVGKLTDAQLAASPRFLALLASHNGDKANARAVFAKELADEAMPAARALGAASGAVTLGLGAGRFASQAASKALATGAISKAFAKAGLPSVVVKGTPVALAAKALEGGAAKSVLTSTVRGALEEAGKEYVQEFGEQVIANKALADGGLEQDLLTGAFEAGAQGALTGAGTAVGVKAAGGAVNKAVGPIQDQGDTVVLRGLKGQYSAARRGASADRTNLAMHNETGLVRLRDMTDEKVNPADVLAADTINSQVVAVMTTESGFSPEAGILAGRAVNAILHGRVLPNPRPAVVEIGDSRVVVTPNGELAWADQNNPGPASLLADTQAVLSQLRPGLEAFAGRSSGWSAPVAVLPTAAAAVAPAADTPVADTPVADTPVAPVADTPVADTPVVPAVDTPTPLTPDEQRQFAASTARVEMTREPVTPLEQAQSAIQTGQNTTLDTVEQVRLDATLGREPATTPLEDLRAALSATTTATTLREVGELQRQFVENALRRGESAAESEDAAQERLNAAYRQRELDALWQAEINRAPDTASVATINAALQQRGQPAMTTEESQRAQKVFDAVYGLRRSGEDAFSPVDRNADNAIMEALIPERLRAVDAARNGEADGEPVSPEVLAALNENRIGDALRLLANDPKGSKFNRGLATRLAGLLDGATEVRMVPTLKDTNGNEAYGGASSDGRVVWINTFFPVTEETVLHEASHAASEVALAAPIETLTPAQREAKAQLQTLMRDALADPVLQNAIPENAKENLSEFVAWGLSDMRMQAAMHARPYPQAQSFVTKFRALLLKLIGMFTSAQTNPSMLDALVAGADVLFDRPGAAGVDVNTAQAAPANFARAKKPPAGGAKPPATRAPRATGRAPGDALAAMRANAATPPTSDTRAITQALRRFGLKGLRQPGTQNAISSLADGVVRTFSDSLLPMVRWIERLPVSQRFSAVDRDSLMGAMYRAPNVRDNIISQAVTKYGGEQLQKQLASMLTRLQEREPNSTAEDVVHYAGYWLTGRYVGGPQGKNARMVEAAEREWMEADVKAQTLAGQLVQAQAAGGPTTRLQRQLIVAQAASTAAFEALTDRQYALAQGLNVNLHVGRNGAHVGLAGGFNDAQAADAMRNAERKFSRAELEKMAQHVYRINSYRLAVDLESGRTSPAMAGAFAPELRALEPEMLALLAAAQTGDQRALEAARDDFINKAAAVNMYVPTSGDPTKALESDAVGQGVKAPNVRGERRLEGRESSIADDGLTTSMGALTRSAAAAGWNDFAAGIEQAYRAMTPDQRSAAGLVLIPNATILNRESDNIVMRGDHAYKLGDGSQLAALRKENVDGVSRLWSVLEVPTRGFAYLATRTNPPFAPINAWRDLWERSEMLRTRQLLKLNGKDVDTAKAARRMYEVAGPVFAAMRGVYWAKNPSKEALNNKYAVLLREFEALGGGGSKYGAVLARDRGQMALEIESEQSTVRQKMRVVADVIARWNDAFDYVAAVSAYAALKEQGMGAKDAAAATLELMNYRKVGTAMPALRAFYAFAQPAVTGGTNLIRALKTPVGRKRIAGYVLGLMALKVLMASLAEEDEELGRNRLDLLSEGVLDRTLPIPIPGTDTIAKLPLGFGLPHLANVIAGQMLGVFKDDQTALAAIGEVLSRGVLPAFTPFDDPKVKLSESPAVWVSQFFAPTLADPVINVATNRTGLGGKVVQDRYLDNDPKLNPETGQYELQPKAAQGSPWLPEDYRSMAMAVRSAAGLDMAPEQVREILRGYSAGALRLIVNAAIENPHKEQMGKEVETPIVSAFVSGYNTHAGLAEMHRFADKGEALLMERTENAAEFAPSSRDAAVLALYEEWLGAEKQLRQEAAALTRAGVDKGMVPERMALREQREAVQAGFVKRFNELR